MLQKNFAFCYTLLLQKTNSSKMIKELNLGIKEISSKILESFRREHLTFEDISLLNQHIKIHDL